ncbi:MAG TPA: sigma 54-interacting transcriptional regulator [Thermoanaerobaculia bacterium]|nr:sigma 54-interacting transcriptional regulator [Thermoanaerobaculia bacterium]
MRIPEKLSIWWTQSGGPPEAVPGVVHALASRGLETHRLPADTDDAGGPVVLLADGPQPDLAERVAALSRHGNERLIVAARSRAAVADGAGWRLLAAGASDVVTGTDADIAELVAARFARWHEVDRLLDTAVVARNLVGRSAAWRHVLRQIVEISRFSSSAVLLAGESGTGKELVARLIHTLDGRDDKRELVVLDCTTIVPELSGSEFFGHERGSFTSAVAARDGAFCLADGGTLVLDEVGELPPRLQAELLRVVQEGTYKRVGSNAWQRTRFRLVCATHRDLAGDLRDGRFRQDFYYRIAAWTCRLPPLRERREDVPLLVRHFLAERYGEDAPEVDGEVLDLLVSRDYPGNVRDLRQLVGRIAHRHVGTGPLTLGDVPVEERPAAAGRSATSDGFDDAARLALARGLSLKEIGGAAGDAAVRIALEEEGGSIQRAARRLGVTDRALQLRRASHRQRDA